jgi:hypothetical protein
MREKNTANCGEIPICKIPKKGNSKFQTLRIIRIKRRDRMIIYNVTTNIHESVHDQWLKWMQEKHIPEILGTGKFSSARIVKVLIEEEMGGVTYSVQYVTDSKQTLEQYYMEDAPRFRQEALELFADKMLSFRTELEVVSEH